MTAQRYRDIVIEPINVQFAGCLHRARIITESLEFHGINRMEWPARSPDMNYTEHV